METESAIKNHIETCDKLKLKMPQGPWMNEPHRLEFKHAGLDCLLTRNYNLFHWCGYVGVPKEHPLNGKKYSSLYDYDKESGVDIRVHGGLTYSEECQNHVCHLTEDGDKIWWFGFDCAHADDYIPGMDGMECFHHSSTYKDIDYLINETKSLAEQLAKVA